MIRFESSDSWKIDWDFLKVHGHEEGSGRRGNAYFGVRGSSGLAFITVLRRKERMATIPHVGHDGSEGLDVQGSHTHERESGECLLTSATI